MKYLPFALALSLLALLPACETAQKPDTPRVNPSFSTKMDAQLANIDKKVIPAQYPGLADRTVAVFVDVPEKYSKDYPNCQREIARKTARYISDYVQGVSVVNPDQIVDLQRGSPEWRDMSSNALVEWINVERVVIVDINHVEFNDPDDNSEHLAVIMGKVAVIEHPATLNEQTEGNDELDGEASTPTLAGTGEFAFINNAAAFVATDEMTSSADFADKTTLKFQLEWRFATKVGHLFVDHY